MTKKKQITPEHVQRQMKLRIGKREQFKLAKQTREIFEHILAENNEDAVRVGFVIHSLLSAYMKLINKRRNKKHLWEKWELDS